MKPAILLLIGICCLNSYGETQRYSYKVKDAGLLYGVSPFRGNGALHTLDVLYEQHFTTCYPVPVLSRIYKAFGISYVYNTLDKTSAYGLRLAVSPWMLRPSKTISLYSTVGARALFNGANFKVRPELGAVLVLPYLNRHLIPKAGISYTCSGRENERFFSLQAGIGIKIR